ncbi:MAG: PEP-CTERM sorting domain-containing protein [Rubrivivax sp.]
MNIFKGTIRGLAALALAAGAFIAQAAPVVSVNPATQNIGVGGTALVDIVVSGLTEPTGGFSLTLTFDSSIVSGVTFTNDPDGKMGLLPLDLSGGFTGNTLDLYFVADALETSSTLSASEGASFTLASLSFLGLIDGTSPLTLSSVVLSNWDGTATLAGVTSTNGSICVGTCDGGPTVPEPATALLLATALGIAGATRRRAKQG